MRRLLIVACLVATAVLVAGAAAGLAGRSTRVVYPDSIVALGHSGVTGYNSDTAHQNRDAPANSWVTGTNPAVDSLYLRILARNPKIKGHNVNLGVDGSTVDDLPRQAREAIALKPAPQLVVIQTVDNDIRCDGTDQQNYRPFGATLIKALTIIASGAPRARIFIVSSPIATVRRFAETFQNNIVAVSQFEGTGRCDLFNDAARATPGRWAYLQKVIDGYYAVLVASCRRFSHCRYDDGAMAHLDIVAHDFAYDYNHLSIQGLRKAAAVEWAALY